MVTFRAIKHRFGITTSDYNVKPHESYDTNDDIDGFIELPAAFTEATEEPRRVRS